MTNAVLNKRKDHLFNFWGILSTLIGLILLALFIGYIITEGYSRLDWDFITGLPSRRANKTGIYTALLGSLWVLFLTTLIAIPIGVGAGIYLEEYNKKNWWSNVLEVNIANLAGVPSIVYGLLGLEVFGRIFGFGGSLLTGSLTLSLLVLPIVIVSTRESIKAVPNSIKDASMAMGATKWQTIWNQVLPSSIGGILTGVILAISRAIGETAPLIVIGALVYVPFAPKTPMDDFSVLPI